MNKEPSLFLHMVEWGLFIGTILIVLLMLIFNSLYNSMTLIELLIFLLNPASWFISLVCGGSLGVIFGWLIKRSIKNEINLLPRPFTRMAMLDYRQIIYARVTAVPIALYVVGMVLATLIGSIYGTFFVLIYLTIPLLLITIASVYVVHRYLIRLHRYDMQVYGTRKRKHKVKNDHLAHQLEPIEYDDPVFAHEEQHNHFDENHLENMKK